MNARSSSGRPKCGRSQTIKPSRAAAFELANHGTVILVGRNQGRLSEVQQAIEREGQHAFAVVGDLSDVASVRAGSSREIVAMNLPINGLLSNAGVMETRPTATA